MKCAYVLLSACCLLAVGLAKPAAPLLNYQDNYGQYSFGYSGPTSARSEVRTLDGVTRGTYSYIDDAGVIQTARYIADDMGFRITATNIPQGLVYLRTPQDVGLLQLKAQEADQAPNLGATNVFLKLAKQEAALTPGDNQQAPGAASDDGSGPASTTLQTKIGENNVFLKQAKGASGEIPIPKGVALVPDKVTTGSIIDPSIDRTREADRNEFLKLLKQWKASGKIGNVAENVKSDYNIAAAGVATNKDGSQGNLNIAAKKTEGESAQKGDTLSQDVKDFLKYIGF